jgi:hypothetical protein
MRLPFVTDVIVVVVDRLVHPFQLLVLVSEPGRGLNGRHAAHFLVVASASPFNSAIHINTIFCSSVKYHTPSHAINSARNN